MALLTCCPAKTCGVKISLYLKDEKLADGKQRGAEGLTVDAAGHPMWPPELVSKYSLRKACTWARFPHRGKSPRSLSQDLIRRPSILSDEALTDPAARAPTRAHYIRSRCWRKVSKAALSNLRTDPRQLSFRAFSDDREKAIEVVLAHEWVRTARLTEIQSMKFIERLVVERMKGQVNIGVSLSCDILESLCRGTPGFGISLPRHSRF